MYLLLKPQVVLQVARVVQPERLVRPRVEQQQVEQQQVEQQQQVRQSVA